MKRSSITVLLVCCLIVLGSGWAHAQSFSGRVYDGASGVETTPLSGVTVTLYGSNNSGSVGTAIASTTTNSSGWYGLIYRESYEYYNIVETDPSGYNSTGASSVDGTVVSSNQIQYTYPLTGKTLTGNKFYDQVPQTSQNNPPVADAGGPYYASIGEPIVLDASGSYDPDSGDNIVQYEWFWTTSSGSLVQINGAFTTPTANWVPAGPISTYVTVKVTDSHGATDTDTAILTVTEEDEQTGAGAVYGMVFNDLNGNYQKDAGEPGLSGWQITLNNQRGTSTTITTGSNGTYSFINLTPDPNYNYLLTETLKTGWTQTYPGAFPSYYSLPMTGGNVYSDMDFGNMESSPTQPPGNLDYGDAPLPYPEAGDSLGGPWIGGPGDSPDAESGMQRDAHALGDDNAGVDDENGIKVMNGPMILGGSGFIEFIVSAPQSYPDDEWATFGLWIDFNQDGDWDDSGETIGFFQVNRSDIGPTFFGSPIPMSYTVPSNAKAGHTFLRARVVKGNVRDLTPSGTALPGEVEDYEIEILDSGTPPPPGGAIPGAKFNDQNGNGVWDTGEPGLAGWTIWLDTNDNFIQDPGEPTTQTDANGNFLFTGLSDGSYAVFEVNQPGWAQTTPPPLGPILPGSKVYYPFSVVFQNGQPREPFPMPIFGNRQTRTPGGGTGAVKWFQPPLFDPEKFGEKCFYGWGEPAMEGMVTLADDWFCYSPRPVSSVTWWGTYAGWDSIAPPPNAPHRFHIGVWTHKPKGGDVEWARPNQMIRDWVVDRNQLGETVDLSHRMPEWKDNQPDTCFRYTFSIFEPEWFQQEGDSTEYWLSIAAVYQEPPTKHVWGWLTRELYFNATAVRILVPVSARPDSLFRIGERLPEHWDMAFELGTDQNTALYDFGDAPDGYGTTWSHNGALHLIRQDIRLGETVDAEDDGRPDPQALGDDKNGSADEDGVSFLGGLVAGKMAKAAVQVSAHGYLSAWLDVGGNGKWDIRDRVINNAELTAGNHVLDFPVADDAVPGKSIVRFRFSTLPEVWVKGFAPNGEVEDYQVDIQKSSTGMDGKKTGVQPGEFKLYPNYPNPFNPSTTIRFELPKAGRVRLAIYNLMGQEIAVLVDDKRQEGMHEVRWNGLDARHLPVPTGLYLYRLEAAPYHGTGKLLLLK
jgi:hypothetical protein